MNIMQILTPAERCHVRVAYRHYRTLCHFPRLGAMQAAYQPWISPALARTARTARPRSAEAAR